MFISRAPTDEGQEDIPTECGEQERESSHLIDTSTTRTDDVRSAQIDTSEDEL